MDSNKLTVGVMGYYGKGNIGDESYKLSFPKLFPQYNFIFTDYFKHNINKWILGGGDIITQEALTSLANIEHKHILSATISKPFDLKSFKTICVRDNLSINNCPNSEYCPDFAFALKPDPLRGKEILKRLFQGSDLYEKVIGVVVNRHLLPKYQGVGTYKESLLFENMAMQLADAIDSTMASFVFLPFGTKMPWDDRITNSWVASKCKWDKKNVVVYEILSVQETLDIMSSCNALISTRLHSSIFGCLSGVPFVDIVHNHKNKTFLETNQLVELGIPYNGVSSNSIIEKLKFCQNECIEEKLKKITLKQQQRLYSFAAKFEV